MGYNYTLSVEDIDSQSPASLTSDEGIANADSSEFQSESVPDSLLILPVRNTVLYPGIIIPITVARDKSIRVVKDVYGKDSKLVGVVAQMNPDVDAPTADELYRVGTMANILRYIRMPNGSVTVIIEGITRFVVDEFVQSDPYFRANVSAFPEIGATETEESEAANRIRITALNLLQIAPGANPEAKIAVNNIENLSSLIHYVSQHLNASVSEKQSILEKENLLEAADLVIDFLNKEAHLLTLNEKIQSRVRSDIDKQQRDYILRQQIKAIQDELGEQGVEQELDELRTKALHQKWSEAAKEAFEKEVNKLYRFTANSPEYSVSMNYIDWMLDLPWKRFTKDRYNLKLARKILDDDHFGLDKVKERILEYLAVLKLKSNMKAPILCFYGPPGVGKTSLGKSIAKALNRKFVRISLGGVRDEAEIRGHRRTYIGALPGRILQGLKKAKSGNPVFVLDEIDKLASNWNGDPSAALLEVLDPEQNNAFNDHYLELDYDLSSILFIATANSLETLHPALRDRMEIIEINGYSMPEKLEIAKRHLVPHQLKEHGLKPEQLTISSEALQMVIESYTRESGVRRLSQQIASICRGVAKDVVENRTAAHAVGPEQLPTFLGVRRFESELYSKVERPGVAVGLAWTSVGGEILFIETALIPGNGKLTLTGQLGEVMKESAHVAYIYLKSIREQLNIPLQAFQHWDVHLHIPAGGIPKDGPSAGIAMLSAMASAFTQRLVKPAIAQSGEITLRGKVMPVGGLKEKILAADRAGIHTVILCADNFKDVEEIDLAKQQVNVTLIYVDSMLEVLDLTLEANQILKPIDLSVSPHVPAEQKAIATA
jgi:ATP-dependent Lon protease